MRETEQRCLHLVEAIERSLGSPLSAAVRQAFLAVDRRHFVPRYYVQQGRQWQAREADDSLYEDRFLFVRLDERGVPTSSSSQPSLMAQMLEALALIPGQRVLEIGTGTGYNAALLGAIVGPRGRVISVDIAPDLVESAAARLDAFPWIETNVANGSEGYTKGAPYDRIIATASAVGIPPAWIEQLAVGGILVGSLRLPLSTATPLYQLVKQADGNASGTLLSLPAFFMPLAPGDGQASQTTSVQVDWAHVEALPIVERGYSRSDFPKLLRDPALALFVELHLPGLQAHLRYLSGPRHDLKSYGTSLLLPKRETMVTFFPDAEGEGWTVEVRGRERLWSMLQEVVGLWEQLGKPSGDHYGMEVERTGQVRVFLRD